MKSLCLFLLSGFWLFSVINSASDAFGYNDKLFILSWVAVVCAVQAGALAVRGLRLWERNVLLAAFAAINFLCLYLVFVPWFAGLMLWHQLLLVSVIFPLMYCFFASLTGGWWTKSILVVVALLCLGEAGRPIFWQKQIPDALVHSDQETASPNIRIVNFSRKPNIYFISLDALIPESLAKKYLDLDSLPYHDWLLSRDFQRFNNSFSDGPSTKSSLNRMLAMDPDYYATLARRERHFDLYGGLSPAPLFEIFKANGYRTNTYSRDSYMGREIGPHVDKYAFTFLLSYCGNLPLDSAFSFGFFGYCQFVKSDLGSIKLWLHESLDDYYGSSDEYVKFLLDDFERRIADPRPSFMLAYIKTPGHVGNDFDYKNEQALTDYKNFYAEQSAGETLAIIRRIVDFIQAKDPDAYIYLFGDHGLLMSRREIYEDSFSVLRYFRSSELDEAARQFRKSAFLVRDLYGIFSAFYPADACTPYLAEAAFPERYKTVNTVVRQIIRCLADGEDPYINPLRHHLHSDSEGYLSETPGDYKNYLYE